MFPFSPKWAAPLGIAGGLILLVTQVVAYLHLGLISARLLGGGLGLLFIGVVSTFYYFDDRRSRARFPAPPEPEWLTNDEPFEVDDGHSDSLGEYRGCESPPDRWSD